MKILFNNLQAQYTAIKSEIDEAVKSAIHSFQYVRGNSVTEFEKAFSEKLGSSHCISTGNGTDALFASLKAIGVGYGDEVLTPAFSWISSAETISLCGAKPVFVDVHEKTYTIDCNLLEASITPKTKAVIVVHLYGQTAHLSLIKKICKQHKLWLIEDCAQAHLSQELGAYAGTVGDIAAFSFYPTKNLGAFGDAGCILTQDDSLAERVRRLTNHGALKKDDHLIEGFNSRMDSIQAAILTAKLPYLESWNTQRRQNAQHYRKYLANLDDLILPHERPDTVHTYHLFVIRSAHRDQLKAFLEKRGIQTIIHYPKALVNSTPYLAENAHKRFPVSCLLENEVLSLPIYPELSAENIEFVCENIREFHLN